MITTAHFINKWIFQQQLRQIIFFYVLFLKIKKMACESVSFCNLFSQSTYYWHEYYVIIIIIYIIIYIICLHFFFTIISLQPTNQSTNQLSKQATKQPTNWIGDDMLEAKASNWANFRNHDVTNILLIYIVSVFQRFLCISSVINILLLLSLSLFKLRFGFLLKKLELIPTLDYHIWRFTVF